MDNSRRPITVAALELRERTVRIRAAARKGKTSREIAEANDVPLKAVEQILAPVAGARLSDPAELLNHRTVATGLPTADIQVYWVGFLTAAGRIYGQGPSFALIVRLGDRSQEHTGTLMADLTTPQVRHEFCRSSLLGWQLYLRDADLCQALIRWGIPSERHGEDSTVLDDLPKQLVAPFLRGYLDGTWAHGAAGTRSAALAFYGTETVLVAINAMIKRGWSIGPGKVTLAPSQAALKFNVRDGQAILQQIDTYTTRTRSQAKRRPA